MKYNCKMLGEILKSQLEQGYDLKRISRRFFDIYFKDEAEEDPLTEQILAYLYLMESDPQLEYTEEELKKICQLLILGRRDELEAFIKR
jgi:hypothetical protein